MIWAILMMAMISCGPEGVLAVMPFIRTNLKDNKWNSTLTTYQSFLACSVKCQNYYPVCQVFAWIEGQCYHGTVVYTWEWSNSYSLAFMAEEVLAATVGDAANIFEPKTGIFGQHGLALVKESMPFDEGKQLCTDAGGQMLIPNVEGLLDYIFGHILPKGEDAIMWVNLEAIAVPLTCQNEECNDQLTWGDNSPYVHPSFIPCIGIEIPGSTGYSFYLLYNPTSGNTLCGTTHEQPFWSIYPSPRTNVARIICQFDL